MSAATTELPGLLRGCIKWRDGRPWVDDDALLVVADWCEENGRAEQAGVIRTPLVLNRTHRHGYVGAGYVHLCERALRFVVDDPDGQALNIEAWLYEYGSDDVPAAALACRPGLNAPNWDASGGAFELPFLISRTRVPNTPHYALSDEATPTGRVRKKAIRRITDLARWDLICHMLGHPPMRLIAEE
jgi:hypothetical protein